MRELIDLNKEELRRSRKDLSHLPEQKETDKNKNLESKDFFGGKVIIITGASSGIGRAMAINFASKGANVVLAARKLDRLNRVGEIIASFGGNALIVPTDVSVHRDCYFLIDKTLEKYGKIDILINNAGISMRASFLDVDIDVLQRVMNTNFWGTVYCTRHALRHLIESKGSLVSISSICGITPLPGRTGYAASKHALDGFIDTIRVEQIPNKLHVLSVHAGFTSSNIRNRALNRYGNEQRETPRNEEKMMSAEKVANEVAKALTKRKRDITLTRDGKLIVWLYKRLPAVADKILYKEMAKEVNSPI
ncbi:MAG: short chain dehydrogenase [Bacteroidetes bacterium]|nr:MAG: short chain dehydrogenase [Bacteroidota bacterium]